VRQNEIPFRGCARDRHMTGETKKEKVPDGGFVERLFLLTKAGGERRETVYLRGEREVMFASSV